MQIKRETGLFVICQSRIFQTQIKNFRLQLQKKEKKIYSWRNNKNDITVSVQECNTSCIVGETKIMFSSPVVTLGKIRIPGN